MAAFFRNLILVASAALCIFFLKTKFQDKKTIYKDYKINHLGIIMDGNRRWAKNKLKMPWEGHKAGIEPVETTIKFCLINGIKILSLYAFSIENLSRPDSEKREIFGLSKIAEDWPKKPEFKNIKICVIGDRTKFPQETLSTILKLEEETKNNSGLTVNVLFCYGGQQEIVAAVKKIAEQVKQKELSPDEIDLSVLKKNMWMGDLPEPDLIIRTGKRSRLSNFLTLQSAYSELIFLDIFWPELEICHLEEACEKFAAQSRTFGS